MLQNFAAGAYNSVMKQKRLDCQVLTEATQKLDSEIQKHKKKEELLTKELEKIKRTVSEHCAAE